MPLRAPTSVDVAQLSGVSQATVSYVMNNKAGQTIPAATRERVLAAAAQLGYSPSRAAQNLKRGHSRVIILNAPPGPLASIAAGYYAALSERLDAAGWTLLSHFPPLDHPAKHLLRLIDATGADAVLDGYGDADAAGQLRSRGVIVVPMVPNDRQAESLIAPVEVQLGHLLEVGHRQFAYVAPTREDEVAATRMRFAHLRARAADLGIPEPARLEWTGSVDELATGLKALVNEGVTAVLAHNDDTALPVLAAAHAAGLGIPQDLALVGVDDTPFASWAVPPLSSVRIDLSSAALNEHAAYVLDMLAGGSPTLDHEKIIYSLVRRETS